MRAAEMAEHAIHSNAWQFNGFLGNPSTRAIANDRPGAPTADALLRFRRNADDLQEIAPPQPVTSRPPVAHTNMRAFLYDRLFASPGPAASSAGSADGEKVIAVQKLRSAARFAHTE